MKWVWTPFGRSTRRVDPRDVHVDRVGGVPRLDRRLRRAFRVHRRRSHERPRTPDFLLDEVYKMGESFVRASERLVPPGMPGPFCLEGVYDREGKFTTFEFSARIVAGTNLYLDGSPYSGLLYNDPMSMGRRIAREVKTASKKNKLTKVVT